MSEQSLILHDPADGAVSAMPDAVALKVAILEECALIGGVKNAAQQEAAVQCLSKLKRILADTEKARKAIKEVHLEKCREIDAKAREHIADVSPEYTRIDDLVKEFQEGEREKVR